MAEESQTQLSPVELAAELTAAWLSNGNTRTSAEEIPAFLKSMHATIVELQGAHLPAEEVAPRAPEFTPAVSARKSLADPNFIISMIDGKPYRSLKRHLTTRGLTPEEYRARYGLKSDYPMTAPAYSEQRREVAKRLGLGRKPGQKTQRNAASKAK